MTEKVKLTQEQAEAIKNLKRMLVSDDVIVHNTVFYQVTGRERDTAYKPFKGIDLDTLIRALYIGYEVEETYKVGDWVIRIEEGSVNNGIDFINVEKGYTFEVTSKNDAGTCVCGEGRYHSPKKLRHATPEEIAEEKQRRWWAKHGRKVWEIREGDVLYLNELPMIVQKRCGSILQANDCEYAFDMVIDDYRTRVICFAEDRKDI